MNLSKQANSISLATAQEVYTKISENLGSDVPVVMIGGWAVNFLCLDHKRPTHDIDMVVIPRGKSIERAFEESPDFHFTKDEVGGQAGSRLESYVGKIMVDLYSKRELAGIDLDDIAENAVFRSTASRSVERRGIYVASPAMMILLKYGIDRRGKDNADINNILFHYYGGSDKSYQENMARFMDMERPLLDGLARKYGSETKNPFLREYIKLKNGEQSVLSVQNSGMLRLW